MADELFNYTSGRWLYNEPSQLRQRFSPFNVHELEKLAVSLIPGASSVRQLRKLAEGNFNKALLLTCDNDTELIVRIRNPNAGPPHYTTASEVATMSFVRNHLRLPVPKVLAWNSRKSTSENPVGAEYIIMERARGVELGKVWGDLESKQRAAVARQIATIEHTMRGQKFPCYGSLYFKNDLGAGDKSVTLELGDGVSGSKTYVLGPSNHRIWWEREREDMLIDRGPWSTLTDLLLAIGHREHKWISQYAKPHYRYATFTEPVKEHPGEHLSLLDRYLAIVSRIELPEATLARPTFCHRDLHMGNIFITPVAAGETPSIVDIIDWQSLSIGPLFLQSRLPPFVCPHDAFPLKLGLYAPSLPPNYDSLSPDERERENYLIRCARLQKLYEALVSQMDSVSYSAMCWSSQSSLPVLIGFAGDSWGQGSQPFEEALLAIVKEWDLVAPAGCPCPISFSEAETSQVEKKSEDWRECQEALRLLRSRVGTDEEGWVFSDIYDGAKEESEKLKNDYLALAKPADRELYEKAWPLQTIDDGTS